MQKEQMSRVYEESFIVYEMMDDASFTSFLTVFQVTSGRCAGNNERLNAMELRFPRIFWINVGMSDWCFFRKSTKTVLKKKE